VAFIAARGLNGRGWAVTVTNPRTRAHVRGGGSDDVGGQTSSWGRAGTLERSGRAGSIGIVTGAIDHCLVSFVCTGKRGPDEAIVWAWAKVRTSER
jgi:hypothetical protein